MTDLLPDYSASPRLTSEQCRAAALSTIEMCNFNRDVAVQMLLSLGLITITEGGQYVHAHPGPSYATASLTTDWT